MFEKFGMIPAHWPRYTAPKRKYLACEGDKNLPPAHSEICKMLGADTARGKCVSQALAIGTFAYGPYLEVEKLLECEF